MTTPSETHLFKQHSFIGEIVGDLLVAEGDIRRRICDPHMQYVLLFKLTGVIFSLRRMLYRVSLLLMLLYMVNRTDD